MLRTSKAFTLVEILIVVVILGILAALVVPSFASAIDEATVGTTQSELHKLRRAVEVYQVRNDEGLPNVVAGDGTWGDLIAVGGQYLKQAPVNAYVGSANQGVIVLGAGPDAAYQMTHGWIFDAASGQVWAGGFDINDEPLPRP
jgi:general secretion pathway protein G